MTEKGMKDNLKRLSLSQTPKEKNTINYTYFITYSYTYLEFD